MIRPFRAMLTGSRDMLKLLYRYRRVLLSTTLVELRKRYAGSVFGKTWILLQPILLLLIYIFVYQVVFRMRIPGQEGTFYYTLFVFSGLIPYIGFQEAITSGCVSVKQNIHLVKNVILPIELAPVRVVLFSLVTQLVGMAVLLLLVLIQQTYSWHLLLLPVVVGLQVLFTLGLCWILACLAIVLPDLTYFVNLSTFLFMFVSPIGFSKEMVPGTLALVLYFNPVYYIVEMYRCIVLTGTLPAGRDILVYVVMSLVMFGLGAAFFNRFKDILTDYE